MNIVDVLSDFLKMYFIEFIRKKNMNKTYF